MTEASPEGSAPAGEAVHVVAAVVVRDGRYLLGRRPRHKRHGGLWEFPGGKMLPGEGFLAAARRELAEELSLDVRAIGRELLAQADRGAPFTIHFVEVDAVGEPEAHEHAEVAWFHVDELPHLSLAPADARFAAWLRG